MKLGRITMGILGGLFFSFLFLFVLIGNYPILASVFQILFAMAVTVGPLLFVVLYPILCLIPFKSTGIRIIVMNLVIVPVTTLVLTFIPLVCFNGILQRNAEELETTLSEARMELTEEEQKLVTLTDYTELEEQMKIIESKSNTVASIEGNIDAAKEGQLVFSEVVLYLIPVLYVVYTLVCLIVLYFYNKKQKSLYIVE